MSTNEATNRIGVGLATSAFERIGFTFREQPTSDVGIDAHAELRDDGTRATGQLLAVQLKTGRSYLCEGDGDAFVHRPKKRHVQYWLKHSLPVIIALCDQDSGQLFWQHVSPESVVGAGAGHKILVPKAQRVDATSREALAQLVTPVVSPASYTVFKLEDISHAMAKRYSAEIVLCGPRTKAEVAAVVRQATLEHMASNWYRSQLTKARFGKSDADVVWTFVYLNAADQASKTWVCRSIWISEGLDSAYRPSGLDGENVGMDIIVDWSTKYEQLSELLDSHTLGKAEYVALLDETIARLKPLVGVLQREFNRLEGEVLSEPDFLTNTAVLRNAIRQLYLESMDIGRAPYECRDVDQKLEELLAHADNAALVYENLNQFQHRQAMARGYLEDFDRTLSELSYESGKIR